MMRNFLTTALLLGALAACSGKAAKIIQIRSDSELFVENNKWGVKSPGGTIIIEPKWDVIGHPSTLSDDRLVVSKDGKYGFIDSQGDLVINTDLLIRMVM